jgi:hypothetical protein
MHVFALGLRLGRDEQWGVLMIKLLGRAVIPTLSLVALLGMFVSPAMASSYIVTAAGGPYQLQANGTYGGTNGGASAAYYSADFAESVVSCNCAGTTYGFYFTISTETDYLNISEPYKTISPLVPGSIEGFNLTIETYLSGTPPSITPTATEGPYLVWDTTGFSLAFSTPGNYYVTLNLECGDTSSCNNVPDGVDPSNFINLTPENEDSIISLNSTPIPAAFPLFASGLGVVGLLARRRKRNTAALAA